jgi:centrosomal protein CEP128
MRQQLAACRQELRELTEHKESELLCLFEHIERQEQLLEEFHQEKRGGSVLVPLFFLCLHETVGLE